MLLHTPEHAVVRMHEKLKHDAKLQVQMKPVIISNKTLSLHCIILCRKTLLKSEQMIISL
jgi:hypothetical protein